MKQRITGRISGAFYEVLSPAGDVMRKIPLEEAQSDPKLAAAIERNGWESL